MADKVVQLVDKDNNNVYPIAGALAQGSVNTGTINDGAVTAEKIDFSTLAFGNYSTTEQDTGFTWIDGKTIYKKTINFGALPNNTEKTVPHGISNLGRVIKVEGYSYNNDVFFPLPFPWTSAASSIGILIGFTSINISTGLDRTGFIETYITLYYTKSS